MGLIGSRRSWGLGIAEEGKRGGTVPEQTNDFVGGSGGLYQPGCGLRTAQLSDASPITKILKPKPKSHNNVFPLQVSTFRLEGTRHCRALAGLLYRAEVKTSDIRVKLCDPIPNLGASLSRRGLWCIFYCNSINTKAKEQFSNDSGFYSMETLNSCPHTSP